MSQARIYRSGEEALSDLLNQAISVDGATLLIPDLQRPFRWSPEQVIRLIDSLMRGWPFGTLLLWKVADHSVAEVPSRAFWRLVDRVESDGGTAAGKMDPPVSRGFRMVLDGQQRLQSLLLALTGGDAGFRLEDREWWSSIDPDRAKGKAAQYWSRGALCLDLEEYAQQRGRPGVKLQHVDYTRALRWVVCAAQDGRSKRAPPKSYEFPIPLQSECPGQFIRVSRLWTLAGNGPPDTARIIQAIREDLLPEHHVEAGRAGDLLGPLLDLVLALEQVKQTEVSFLELQPFQKGESNSEQYDDAVVNIFTRLNGGGSALTEEEITFAWIKKRWTKASPDAPEATGAFESLQAALAEEGIVLGMDKLVQAVSMLWAIVERKGKLLRPADLLKGPIVGPMAEAVSVRWDSIAANPRWTSQIRPYRDSSKPAIGLSRDACASTPVPQLRASPRRGPSSASSAART